MEGKEAMVFHGNKWGWRATAARLLLAPVLAAGVAAPVVIAQTPARPPVASAPAAPAKPKAADPKDLLRQGREALRAGQFDKAQDLARRADAANPSGRWGLFGDTPESLENDIRQARAKADRVEAERLTKAARELYAKAQAVKDPADRLAAFDQAHALADRAAALYGPTDLWDGILGGDRPDKVKKEIDAARAQLRKSVPASQLAKAPTPPQSPAPRTGPVAQTGPAKPPAFTPGVQPVGNTGKPADPSKVTTAAANTPPAGKSPTPAPAASPDKPAAMRLLADGRALLRENRLAEAKARAAEAGKLKVQFGPSDDTPDALLRDVIADGKRQVDDLTRQADTLVGQKEYKKAEVALSMAKQIATDLGFYTRQMEDKLASVKQAQTGAPIPVVAVEPPPVVPSEPAAPPAAVAVAGGTDVPSGPIIPAVPATPDPVATVPTAPQPRTVPSAEKPKPAGPVASGPIIPALPVTPDQPPPLSVPPAPVLPSATASAAPSAGERMLEQAKTELRRGDLEAARKLATQAHNGDHGPTIKSDAQALMREIDAEATVRKRKEAVASFAAAADHFNARQYEQALGVFKLIDPTLLPEEQRGKLQGYIDTCTTEVAKLTTPAVPAVTPGEPAVAAGTPTPAAPLVPGGQPAPAAPPAAGLSDQVKALGEVEFQKLRSEGLEVQSKAQEAFNRGDTDVAIQMLTDFTAKVKESGLSVSRQGLLLTSVDRRLETFRIMKRQIDFVTREAKDKQNHRDQVVGRQLADTQRREEIAKKAREVQDLSKNHKYQEAERLALQLKTLEPDDPTLTALYEITKRQRRLDDAQKLKDAKEQFNLFSLNSAENPGKFVDIDNPLHVDPVRMAQAQRRGGANDFYLRSQSAAEREIELRLDRPLSVEFENAPLREVIDEIRKKTQLNVSIDEVSIADEKIDLDQVLVTDSLKDLSTRNILSLVLDKARLKFAVENDVVRITTEKKAKGRLYTKVFSVMDLVTPVPDFALAPHQSFTKAVERANAPPPWAQQMGGGSAYTPPGGLQQGTMVSGPWGEQGQPGGFPAAGYGTLQNQQQNSPLARSANLADSPRQNMSAQLMKLIKGMVKPYSWEELGGPGKLEYYDIGGALVVNQTADIIREVQDLLEALRRLQETSVAVEIRVISLSESFFERVGIDFSMNILTDRGGRDGSSFERMLTTGAFRPEPYINNIDAKGVTVGWNPSMGGFTPDLNVPIRPSSFPFSLPPFGGYPGGPFPNGGLSVGLAFLNDIQVYMFLEAAQGNRRVNVMQAPKITLFNGQTSTVFVSDVAFFTLGLQVFQSSGQTVYIPQNIPVPIGSSFPPPGATTSGQPGVSVTVQAIISADRRFVRMNLAPTLTAITSATVPLFPVTAFITPVFEGGSQGVPIPFTQFFQQPSISEIAVQTTVAVPDGGTVVLGGLKTLAEGRNEFGPPVLSQIPYINRLFRNQGIGRETRHIMIMVTPRIIIQSEEEFVQTGVISTLPAPGAFGP
jgi:type II secretory pathway component GspD/PulD (secretin)